MCKCAKCICFFNKMTNKRIPAAGFEVCGGEFPYVLIPLSQPIDINMYLRVVRGERKWDEIGRGDFRGSQVSMCSKRSTAAVMSSEKWWWSLRKSGRAAERAA